METKYDTVTFQNSIKDTFPFIESAIVKLDNNLSWWKKNFEEFEKLLANEITRASKKYIDVDTKLIIYNGPDENVETVTWSGPAIEFTLIETSDSFVREVKEGIGNTWKGHKLITSGNRLIVLFE
jgi:hypothetical protein